MELDVRSVDVWAASIRDKPGGLADKLAPLVQAGADLDFIISRRMADRPGEGVVFATPLRGDQEIKAATAAGFAISNSLHSVRIEGPNEAGIAARLARMLGDAGINLRGLSAAVIEGRFIIYIALDRGDDVAKAMRLLKDAT